MKNYLKVNEHQQYGSIHHDSTFYTLNHQSRNYVSFVVILLCVLVSDAARGLFFPTLWLYVSSLHGTKSSLGFAVSTFSLGRIVSSPILGYMSELYGYRSILILCNVIIMMGSIVYVFSRSYSDLIIAQTIIGLGAGSLGVTRSYVAESFQRQERSVYLAYLTALQYFGFTVTPIVGALCSYIGNEYHDTHLESWINQYSAPAVFLLFMALLSSICLLLFFKEIDRHHDQTDRSPTGSDVLNLYRLVNFQEFSTSDWIIVGGCFMNITLKGTIGVFETLGLEFAISNYKWSSLQMGFAVSSCGAIGVIFLLAFDVLLKTWKENDLISFGILIMIVSCTQLLPILSIHTPVWQFYLSIIFMYAIGYPIGHTALIGLFSQIQSSGPQGKLMGMFASCGSIARVVFPIIAGELSEYFEDSFVFLILGILLFCTWLTFQHYKSKLKEIITHQ